MPVHGNSLLQKVILNKKNVIQLQLNLRHSGSMTLFSFCYMPPELAPAPGGGTEPSALPSASPGMRPSSAHNSSPLESSSKQPSSSLMASAPTAVTPTPGTESGGAPSFSLSESTSEQTTKCVANYISTIGCSSHAWHRKHHS